LAPLNFELVATYVECFFDEPATLILALDYDPSLSTASRSKGEFAAAPHLWADISFELP
jgi:hypothetical protein